MSDKARHRRPIYCPNCRKTTTHVCYPNRAYVCTLCNRPQPLRRK